MAIGTIADIFKAKLEILLGERGKKPDHAVRFRDLETIYGTAIRQSINQTRPIVIETIQGVAFDIEEIREDTAQLDAALELLQTRTDTLVEDVQAITADFTATLAETVNREFEATNALERIREAVLWLSTQVNRNTQNLFDAGIYIDPSSGKARIEAVARIDEALSVVQISLDAAASQIAARATYTDMYQAIAEAQIDPSQIPLISDLTGRITDAEILLDAQAGLIASKTDNVVFDALGVRVTSAESVLDSVQAQLALTVEQATFDLLEGRVSTTEVILDGAGGASLAINLRDVRQRLDEQQQLDDATLAQVIAAYNERQARQADLAGIRQEYHALVNDEGVARAALKTELVAAIGATETRLTTEEQVRASQDQALAQTITGLQSSLSSTQQAQSATSTAVTALDTRVTQAEGGITTLVSQQTSLSSQLVTLGESLQGFQLALDQIADVLVGAAVTVTLNTGALGLTNTLRINEGAVSRVTSGVPNGATVTIPAGRAVLLAGQRVKIGVLAYAPPTNAATRFGIAYSTGPSSSGYIEAAANLTSNPQWFTFYYNVPFNTTLAAHYLSIFGDSSKLGRGTVVARVYVEVAAVSGDLPEINTLTGQITDIRALNLSALDGTAFGALVEQLEVDANGVSAWVTAQGNAIADLSGAAAASYVFRVGAGGAEAGLELVAADDVIDGPASQIRLNATQILLEGTVTAPLIYVDSLAAISANLGTFTSGNPTGERTVISGDRIEVYDANNILRVVIGDLS